jgi:hypothetical protein
MRTARRVMVLTIVVSVVGGVWACGDSAQPLGMGNKFYNDTEGEDAYTPPPPYTPSPDGAGDAYPDGYTPALGTCGSCSCDPTKNYCMSGGTRKTARERVSYPYGGGFGEPDGAGDAAPPAPCKVLEAGATGNGCIPLPATCAKTPTCDCLVNALQPNYTCYLACSPSPGYLEVYCPNGS